MNRSKLFLPFLFLIVVFGVLFVSNAEIISSYIIDGDTVYIDDENIYIGTTPHTIYGDGWVTSNIVTKNYNGNLNVAYGFNTTQIYPTRAGLYDPHVVPYTTNHQAWFYNVSSITNTPAATPIDYGNEYNTYRYTITSQKCTSYDEMSMTCNEWMDETAVVAFDSHGTDGMNYTAFWYTDRTRIENYRDITHLSQSVDYSYDGKNKWYYVTDIPFTAGEMRSVRTYIKVAGGEGKYDVAVWPSYMSISEAIAAGYFYLLDPWAEVSNLNFTSPTPANESTVYKNHTTINVSIATSDLTYFTFNWNGTNVTYTTAGTEWNQSADSYVRSTTVGSYTQPDFDNIFPWSHMRRCTLWDNGTVNYYLNATNSSLKATGGLSDLTGADGQVMVEIPKFYYGHTLTGSEHDWEVSRFNISGMAIHNAFIKDGVEVDNRYIAAYEGSMWDASTGAMVPSGSITTNMYATGDKLCSISGEYPKTNEQRSEFRAMGAQRGAGWRQLDFDLNSVVQLLYIIEYGDFNSQTKIGSGRTQLSGGTWTAGSYIGQCGKSNGDGDGTNSIAGNTNDAYMTYRGIENWWGNVWKWNDGINIYNNIPYVTNNASAWADGTEIGYTNLSVTLANTNGYSVTLADTDRGFFPTSVGGSSSTYISDYYYQNPGWRVVVLGGHAASGSYAGAFCLLTYAAASYYVVHFGGRLAY